MDEYLRFPEDGEPQGNLEIEVNPFANINPITLPNTDCFFSECVNFSGTLHQLSAESESNNPLADKTKAVETETEADTDYCYLAELLKDPSEMSDSGGYGSTKQTATPHFTYMTDTFLGAEYNLNSSSGLLSESSAVGKAVNEISASVSLSGLGSGLGSGIGSASNFGTDYGVQKQDLNAVDSRTMIFFNTDIFDDRRESVVSDTLTPINSTNNSPRTQSLTTALMQNKNGTNQQNHSVRFSFESPGSQAFALNNSLDFGAGAPALPPSPLVTPSKPQNKTKRRKSSTSSSAHGSPSFEMDLTSMRDKRCVFKPAPKKKSELYLRPERRCPKFEFGVRSQDNVLNISFEGGFIRNTILSWYFSEDSPYPSNFQKVSIEYDSQYYLKMLNRINSEINLQNDSNICTFRTYWRLVKTQNGPHIKLDFHPESLDCEVNFTNTQYYFNIVSRVIRPNSFGPIESGARYRSKMVNDMKQDDSSGVPRWCHFITSAEMKGILDFIFGGLDYIANDDTLPDKFAKGVKPNPFKQHESRIRSHMVGYVSGKKCMKNASKVLTGERKVFAEEMYKQVISYDDKKRPYNTLKEFAVMEAKYMMDNIEDLFEKFYWVDPATVPAGGYKVRY